MPPSLMNQALPHQFSSRTLLLPALLLALTMGTAAGITVAQPKDENPVPTEADRDRIARERARQAVIVRLERIRAEESRLQATLAAIDSGQPLSELRLPEPSPRERPEPRLDTDRDDDRERGTAGEDFTDEQVRQFIAEVYPEWVDRLKELEQRDPDAVARMLQERRPRLVELMIERRDHPEIFEVRQKIARSEMQLRRAAWSYARADEEAEKQQADASLSRILNEQFQLRLELYRAELAEAETEAQRIRQQIEEASANRETLIAERKADLLRAISERRPPQPRGGRPGRDDDRRPRP